MAGDEKTVVRRHFAKLTQAIQDPLHLAHELYQEGILAQSLIGQIRGMNDRTHKNSVLMEAVHDQVTTPTRFHQFLAILKEEESLASIAMSMQSLYGKLNTLEFEILFERLTNHTDHTPFKVTCGVSWAFQSQCSQHLAEHTIYVHQLTLIHRQLSNADTWLYSMKKTWSPLSNTIFTEKTFTDCLLVWGVICVKFPVFDNRKVA